MSPEDIERQGIRFFGRVAASLSHEIKNVLAIINENAGLLGDYASLADKGTPVASERLARVARQLGQQVQRADGMAKNLHRLAHSTDASLASVDLDELVRLLIALHTPLANRHGVRLEILPASAPLVVDTDPFLLETLVAACLEFAIHHPHGDHIQIGLGAGTDGPQLRLRPLSQAATGFPAPAVRRLADRLGVNLQLAGHDGCLSLSLPRGTVA